MNTDFQHFILLSFAFVGLFGLSELGYHLFRIEGEYTRKFVHASTGLICLFFPFLFNSHVWVLALCISFLTLLGVSKKYGFLRSINDINRMSYGSEVYPIVVYLCFLGFQACKNDVFCVSDPRTYFYLPLAIMALCDPIAALVGRKIPIGKIRIGTSTKTLTGLVFFVGSAFLVSMFVLGHSSDFENNIVKCVLSSVLISLTTATAEFTSQKGLDNLTIPITAFVTTLACQTSL